MRRYVWMTLFLAVACLFNPVFPLAFSNYMFGMMSTLAVLLFFFSLELLKPRLSIASITDRMPGDRVLESALILGWSDLMRDAKSGVLHLEYAFTPDSSLDCLKLWSSSTVRGHWHLACGYWTSASAIHDKGIHFEDGFRSESLTDNLEFIMQHQHAFSWPPNFRRTSLLQIKLPTEQEITAAADSVRDAYSHINSFSAGTATCVSRNGSRKRQQPREQCENYIRWKSFLEPDPGRASNLVSSLRSG
jgi:hypothetical protein